MLFTAVGLGCSTVTFTQVAHPSGSLGPEDRAFNRGFSRQRQGPSGWFSRRQGPSGWFSRRQRQLSRDFQGLSWS
jgi:hypothetical protein